MPEWLELSQFSGVQHLSRKSIAIAPQISLPWMTALIIASGPGLPESSVVTYGTPVFPSA